MFLLFSFETELNRFCLLLFVIKFYSKTNAFNGKSSTDFTNPFSPNNFYKNDHIILNYFKNG